MQHRSSCWAALAIAVGLLAVGCRTPQPQNVKAQPDSSSDAKLAEAHAHYALGVLHDLNDENVSALDEFSNAAGLDIANESLVMELSERFITNKKPDKALELLKKATARFEASGMLFAKLGFVYSQLEKTDLAIEANRAAIKKSQGLFVGYQNLFLNYLQSKRADEAWKVLDDASGQTVTDADFFVKLGEAYLGGIRQFPKQKEIVQPKAVAALNHALELKPADLETQLKLAEGFIIFGETDKAVKIYRDVLRQPVLDQFVRIAVRSKLADIYVRKDDHKAAAADLEDLIRDDPTNPQAHLVLGRIAYADKEFEKAEDYFSKAIILNPDFEQGYYEMAEVELGLSKADAALETLDRARTKFQVSFIAEFLTGLAYAQTKQYQLAFNHFNGAEVIGNARHPKRLNENFYFQIGSACERNGEYGDAEKYFKKSLEIAPEFHEAMNYLGYMWADRGVKLTESRALIESALKYEPTNAAYLDSLGWVLFKLNEPQKALEQMLKAEKFSPKPDATLYDHLGEIYSALKQHDKAREAWKKSLDLERSDEIKNKLDHALSPDKH